MTLKFQSKGNKMFKTNLTTAGGVSQEISSSPFPQITSNLQKNLKISPFKKAFTMIELVFVIVVLGIIASIAIPKIYASREDAKVVAAFNELNNFIDNIIAKHTLGHKYSSTAHAEMFALGARVDWAGGDDAYLDFRLGIDEGLSKTCITIPIARSGQTYSWNDIFAFTYGCNDTSMCKRLTELIKKKYPPNEPSSRFGGVCKYQHAVITSYE